MAEPLGRRARALAVVAVLSVAAACSTGGGTATATTTTVAGPSTTRVSTTTTTLASTADPAFHTRRSGVLTVATDQGEPPYFDIDLDTGAAYDGFEYDVARVIASRLGLGRIRVVHGSLEAIQQGYDCLCDLFLGGVVVTEALARRVDLSVPYVAADPAVLVKVTTPAPTLVTAAKLRWAIAVTDPEADVIVTSRFAAPVAPQRLATATAVVRAVATGEADAALLPAPVALLAAASDPTLAVVGRFAEGLSWAAVEPLGSSNSPSLNDVMARLADDGTLAFIARRHLGIDPSTLPIVANG